MSSWWTGTKDAFGNIGDWFSQQAESVTEVVGDLGAEWQRQVNTLKQKAAEFSQLFNKLEQRQALADKSPALKAEYDKVMSLGLNIRNTVQNITSKIDTAVRGFRDFFGMSPNMAGMGAVPLIPIAAIAGTITAITAWLTNAYELDRTLDAVEKLIEQGVSPDKAFEMVKGLTKNEPFININPFKGATGLIVGGVALYFLWPTLRKQWKRLS